MNKSKPSKPPKPTDAELAILRVLWQRGPSTVRDVWEQLNPKQHTGYTTVLKTMQIMSEKGLLARDETDRSHVYRAARSEAQTQRQVVGAGLLAAFVGVLAPLRDILARPLRFSAAAERAPRGWSVFRVVGGTVCLTITTLILVFRPQAAAVGSFTLIAALLALLPFFFNGIVVAFKRVQ